MNQILFTISIISMKNASIIQGPIVLNGEEVENYIHKKHNKNGKHIFDETQNVSVYPDEYFQQTSNIHLD